MNINLHAKPYAHNIQTGYNKAGEEYDIEVLRSIAVLDAWDQSLRDQGLDPHSGPATILFKDWCNRNNVFYYGRPASMFHESEALDLAANACATFLLMEDMS